MKRSQDTCRASKLKMIFRFEGISFLDGLARIRPHRLRAHRIPFHPDHHPQPAFSVAVRRCKGSDLMKRIRMSASRVIAALACLVACVLACWSLPAFGQAQGADKVVVAVEAQTIGQGYIVEPTVVTYDEFISYWAERGQTIDPADITAGGMIAYVLEQNGTPVDGGATPYGPGYLATVKGADNGTCEPPQHIKNALFEEGTSLNEYDGNPDLSEKEYTPTSGWLYTEHNWMSNQSMGSHTFSSFGKPYTVGGDRYYVVRLQYSVYGLGLDLGFKGSADGTPSGPWPAADKGELYAQYAVLSDAGYFDIDPEARTAALSVMENLLASQDQVDAATSALRDGSVEAPVITGDLPTDVVTYSEGDVPEALCIEASVDRGDLSYEWFSSTDKKTWKRTGETRSSLLPQTVKMGTTYYKCVVTNTDSASGLTASTESSIATVVVGIESPVFTVDLPSEPITRLMTDDAPRLEVEAAVPGMGTISYQWFESADKQEWTPIEGATARTFDAPLDAVGARYYRVRATHERDGYSMSAESAIATVDVIVDTPVFDTNLQTTTYFVDLGETAELSVKASVRDGGSISYQWYRSQSYAPDGSIEGMEAIEGATASTYAPDTSTPGFWRYKVVATNELDGGHASAVSNWSAVQASVEEPVITENFDYNEERWFELGATEDAILSIAIEEPASGTITYQWYESAEKPEWSGIDAMTPIEGATSSQLKIDTTISSDGYYACRVTRTLSGEEASADSNVCRAAVSIPKPVIYLDPQDASYQAGTDPDPLVVAARAQEGDELSFQWYSCEYTHMRDFEKLFKYYTKIEGADSSSYTPPASAVEYLYGCVVTSTREVDGKIETSRSFSAPASVSFTLAAPVFERDLVSETVRYEANAASEALEVEATHANPDATISYQWFRDGVAIDGETGASFVPPTDEAGSHVYHVVAFVEVAGMSASTQSARTTVYVEGPQQLISTEQELRDIQPGGNYLLGSDIELTSPWEPVAEFTGTLDGGGHVISGVSIDVASYGPVAFFSKAGRGATIKNLGLSGTITNSQYGMTAGLVGTVTDGGLSISDCFVAMDVNGSTWGNSGGIVGEAKYPVAIEHCYFRGSLTHGDPPWQYGGGIAGELSCDEAYISDSYSATDSLVGKYARFDSVATRSNFSAGEDEWASAIPADMDAFLELLNAHGDAFAADAASINEGYPVLAWQVAGDTGEPEPEPEPDDPFAHVDEHLVPVLDYLVAHVTDPIVNTEGGEWSVLAMARAGVLSEATETAYLANLARTLEDKGGVLSTTSSTDYSRVILALGALGMDPTDVGGYDVLARLADQKFVVRQGVNGAIWALIALDSDSYEVPQLDAAPGKVQTTRDGLIDYLVSKQFADGGWALAGTSADVDVTAMAIQALAPYYGEDIRATEAVDAALELLASRQAASGAFTDGAVENLESTAQVVLALVSIDPDLLVDARFVQNGATALDALVAFQKADGSFSHELGDGSATTQISTDQGALALIACSRAAAGQPGVFDFSDVTDAGDKGEEDPELVAAFKQKVDKLPAAENCRIRHQADISALLVELDRMGSFEGKEQLRAELVERADAILEQLDVVEALDADIWSKIDPKHVTLDDAAVVRALMRRYEAVPVENRRYVEYAEDLIAASEKIDELERAASSTTGGGHASGSAGKQQAGGSGAGQQAAQRPTGQASNRTASAQKRSASYSVDEHGNLVVTAADGIVPVDALSAVAGKDQNLVVVCGTGEDAYRMTLNGLDLDPEGIAELDLSVKPNSAYDDQIAQLAEDPHTYTVSHRGTLPCPVMAEVPCDADDGTYLLLTYDPASKRLTYVQKAEVADGTARFMVERGGIYVIARTASTEPLSSEQRVAAAASGGWGENAAVIAGACVLVGVGGAGYIAGRRRRASGEASEH